MMICVKTLRLTFQDRRGLQDLLLNPGVLTTDGCEELQNQFCALSLPSSGLTTVSQRGLLHTHPIQNTLLLSLVVVTNRISIITMPVLYIYSAVSLSEHKSR